MISSSYVYAVFLHDFGAFRRAKTNKVWWELRCLHGFLGGYHQLFTSIRWQNAGKQEKRIWDGILYTPGLLMSRSCDAEAARSILVRVTIPVCAAILLLCLRSFPAPKTRLIRPPAWEIKLF
ncbi:hypothetical protein M378DRAFT_312407 [Amanita muscaria Koide BX008]|uniref:Uncharacterized protein n=1 Tax=Amanita muscaria (strain Koide BX008) TaxID=946122 RepID=A0A0C2WBF2_AMAMK|nr:hypothetical protein M378DRAFT_312407 [Amanita muscaria Koide BX008]